MEGGSYAVITTEVAYVPPKPSTWDAHPRPT